MSALMPHNGLNVGNRAIVGNRAMSVSWQNRTYVLTATSPTTRSEAALEPPRFISRRLTGRRTSVRRQAWSWYRACNRWCCAPGSHPDVPARVEVVLWIIPGVCVDFGYTFRGRCYSHRPTLARMGNRRSRPPWRPEIPTVVRTTCVVTCAGRGCLPIPS